MANPRIERLQNDYQKLHQLAARSAFVHILSAQGSPPTNYLIKFTCKGVARLDNGRPIYSEDHQVEIVLGPQYPLAKPGLTWKTPIYHPNISSSGSVCIGDGWASGGRYLDDLVIYLMQMVRYDGEDLTFTSHAFNRNAYDWAIANRHLLPTDKRPMFGPRFDINVRGSESLNINVRASNDLNIRVHPKD